MSLPVLHQIAPVNIRDITMCISGHKDCCSCVSENFILLILFCSIIILYFTFNFDTCIFTDILMSNESFIYVMSQLHLVLWLSTCTYYSLKNQILFQLIYVVPGMCFKNHWRIITRYFSRSIFGIYV